MKSYNKILSLLLIMSMVVFSNCGGDDKDDDTEREVVQESLVSKTWSANAASTDVSAVNGDLDPSTFGAVFTKTETGVSFVFSGDIATYLIGGAFDLADDGSVSNATVTTAQGLAVSSIESVVVTDSSVSMTILTDEASAKSTGVGTYTLTFDGVSL